MTDNTMREQFARLKAHERHANAAESRYWCEQYRMFAERLLQQQAAQVPVMGEAVAYGVPNSAITGMRHRLMQVMLEIPKGAQYPDLLVPLFEKPTTSITQAELDALVSLVEGFDWHDWRNKDGLRLKDTPEWVAFYCAVKRIDAAIAKERQS